MLQGVLSHPTLEYLDFSKCNIDDKSGNMLGRVIIRQSQRRDQVVWMYGLRNERPQNNDYALGLVSINLSDNNISDEFAEEIAKALGYDAYIRQLNLSKNSIGEYGCKKLVKSLRKNETVLNIDIRYLISVLINQTNQQNLINFIRNNPGYSDSIQQRLNLKLIKNIKLLKNMNFTIEEQSYINQFINYDYFNIEIPQESKDNLLT